MERGIPLRQLGGGGFRERCELTQRGPGGPVAYTGRRQGGGRIPFLPFRPSLPFSSIPPSLPLFSLSSYRSPFPSIPFSSGRGFEEKFGNMRLGQSGVF